MRALAVLSGVLGFGGGAGLVITGLLMRGDADYHRVFWFTTAFSVLVILVVVPIVPKRPRPRPDRWTGGAAGIAAGLSLVLLAITQGNVWGWTSARCSAAAWPA